MAYASDIVISTFYQDRKIKECIYDFDEIINFDLLGKFEVSFSYTIFNGGCDEIIVYLKDKTIEIKKDESFIIDDILALTTLSLYRLTAIKNRIKKDAVLEVIDESHIFSEVHLTLKSWILSKNHFDTVRIFNGKVKLNEDYYLQERKNLQILKSSNENINALLFALNELRNNLSFETRKVLVKKTDILKNDPYVDFKHSEYIEVNENFVFAKDKNYTCPENVILGHSLTSLNNGIVSLKSLVSLFIKRMNSEIIAYNNLIQSDDKKNISKTNALKISGLYKAKKALIADLNQLLQRLNENITMILNVIGEECLTKTYDFTSLNAASNKYYKKVFTLLSNQTSFNVDYSFLQMALAHSKQKFMLNELVSFYELVAIDKVLNEFGYVPQKIKEIKPEKIKEYKEIYCGKKYNIHLEFCKQKRKPKGKDINVEYMPTFTLKLVLDKDDLLKEMVFDSYTKILDGDNNNKESDDFTFAQEINSPLYIDSNLVNKFIFVSLKNPSKFRNDYLYSFRNCSSYISSLYKGIKKEVQDFLNDFTSIEETIFVDVY